MGTVIDNARSYLRMVQDELHPKNETLAEHREHCEAEEGNCPFEKEADRTDADVWSGSKRSFVTPEEDAAYMDVANRIAAAKREGRDADAKDVETAQRMLREAAAMAMPDSSVVDKDGMPKVVWHGSWESDNTFNVFDNTSDSGIYFTGNYEEANRRGGNARPFFLNAKKGIDKGEAFEKYEGTGGNPRRVTIGKLRPEGYDHWTTPMEIAVFSPFQIKLADISYDDKGKLIPLSRRFDFEKEDIRY